MSKGKQAGTRKQIGSWEWNSTILWSKIVQTDADSCWAWLGSVGPQTNLFGGRKSGQAQMSQARRFLYMDVYATSCDDLQIKHSCGNPFCMNWQHFEVKPNQRRYYLDGLLRGTRVKPDKTEGLVRAKLVPVKQQRWWQL